MSVFDMGISPFGMTSLGLRKYVFKVTINEPDTGGNYSSIEREGGRVEKSLI